MSYNYGMLNIYEGAKKLAKLAQEYGKMDLYQQAVDLMSQVVELQEDNRKLQSEVEDLKGQLKVKGTIFFSQSMYWRLRDELPDGKPYDGPFCTRCWDVIGKLVRVNQSGAYPVCPECQTVFRNFDRGKVSPSI